jgi:hypothetical protein
MRSGTLPTPLCVGLGEACRLAKTEMTEENARLTSYRDLFLSLLSDALTDLHINGDKQSRIPSNLNISFAFVEGESLMMSIKDLAVSSGSACTSASLEPSYVLRALGVEEELAHTSLRIGFGRFTTEDEVRQAAASLIAAVTKAIGEFFGNEPQRSAAYGRIINRRHFERLCALLDGAQIECGGARDADGLYLAPTVVSQLADNAPLLAEEIFGPILPLRAFDDLDQVIASERTQPVPLAMYAFTHDRKIQDRLLNEIRSGGACINDTLMHLVGRELPFGGLGESGMGASHGKASFDAFSHRRSIMRRPFKPDPAMRYPPPRVGFAAFKRILRFFGAA